MMMRTMIAGTVFMQLVVMMMMIEGAFVSKATHGKRIMEQA